MIRPISIALIYGGDRSLKYAKAMRSLILSKCGKLPIIPLLVSGSTDNGSLWTNIESTFANCDYAFIFVSKVFCGYKPPSTTKTLYMSSPNLMLEYGYLIHKLGKDNIKIIIDFEYNEITNGSFVFPSDSIGDYLCPLPDLSSCADKDDSTIKNLLTSVLNNDVDKLKIKYCLSTMNDIDGQNVGMDCLFTRETGEGMQDYSIEKQYSKIFHTWLSEIDEFKNMEVSDKIRNKYVMSYLYSRLLFFPALHGIQISGFDIGKYRVSETAFSSINELPGCIQYNAILHYIVNTTHPQNSIFYTNIKQTLEQDLDRIDIVLHRIIVENYIGLCSLNASIRNPTGLSADLLLRQAAQNFTNVINWTRNSNYANTITEDILCSFAFFNRARANYELNESDIKVWQNDFEEAADRRRLLANQEELPRFLQNYFKQELYHCVNKKIESTIEWYEKEGTSLPTDTRKRFFEEEKGILDELKAYEQTVVAGQPFFKVVKEKARNNLKRLNKKVTIKGSSPHFV